MGILNNIKFYITELLVDSISIPILFIKSMIILYVPIDL